MVVDSEVLKAQNCALSKFNLTMHSNEHAEMQSQAQCVQSPEPVRRSAKNIAQKTLHARDPLAQQFKNQNESPDYLLSNALKLNTLGDIAVWSLSTRFLDGSQKFNLSVLKYRFRLKYFFNNLLSRIFKSFDNITKQCLRICQYC